MNVKIKSKIVASALLCTMCAYSAPVLAFTKDETVYAKMNQEGENYQTIVSTHIENSEKAKSIEDVSDLLKIENTNGEEEFTQEGDSLIWKADGNDIYYQGESQKDLPIECNVKYELEGKEVTADEIVGKTGHVKITIQYINKEEHMVNINGKEEKMYTPFVAVTGTILANDTNKNIQITNGKVMNDGSKSFVIGIAMPGLQESLKVSETDIKIPNDIEISMDATDFSLGNVVTFVTPKILEEDDLAFLDKLDGIYEQVNTLEMATNQMEEGANTLKEGTIEYSKKSQEFNKAMNQVSEGVNTIDDNYSKIDSGIHSLDDGSAKLATGAQALDSGVKELATKLEALPDSVSKLYQGSVALEAGINREKGLAKGVETLESSLSETVQMIVSNNNILINTKQQLLKVGYTENDEMIKNLQGQIEANTKKITALTSQEAQNQLKSLNDGITAISQGANSLEQGLEQLDTATGQLPNALTQLSGGIEALLDGSKALETGANTLGEGSKSMKTGMQALDSNTKKLTSANGQLTEGAKELATGATSLSEGIKTFNEEGMHKICDFINGDGKQMTERIQKLEELSKEYNHFTMLNGENSGNVKFIMIMDAIKRQEEEESKKEDAILNRQKDENKEESTK